MRGEEEEGSLRLPCDKQVSGLLSILGNHEGLRSQQRDPAALFGKLPISFPPGEEPTGGEGPNVGKRTELFVGNIYFHSAGCTSPASVARWTRASASLNSALLLMMLT